jgi:hypothetical protein
MNIKSSAAAPTYGITIEKDVDVPMRDGARLKADVFRPDGDGKFPAILNLGPYQKDKLWIPPDALEEKANPYMNWETVNPEWWVPKGYAAVRVDGRGTGKSPGQCEPWSLAEAKPRLEPRDPSTLGLRVFGHGRLPRARPDEHRFARRTAWLLRSVSLGNARDARARETGVRQ